MTPANSEWERRNVAADSTDCHAKYTEIDSISTNDGLNLISCPSQLVVYPNRGDGTFQLYHTPTPYDGYGTADTIVVAFSRPVGMLAILSEGNHNCYVETFSRVVAYGSGNVELGRTTFRLIPTCRDTSEVILTLREAETASLGGKLRVSSLVSVDWFGPFAEAMLPIPSGVTRLVISPPEAWYWTWTDPFGFSTDTVRIQHEGRYHIIFRPDLQQPAPILTLKCSDVHGVSDANSGTTVVRAQSVSCKASLSPERSTERLTVTDWNFVSTDGTLTRSRRALDPGFDPDSTVWAGPMITSGKVTVTAAVGNELPSTKFAMITVTTRDWAAQTVPFTITPVPTPYADPPKADSELGSNLIEARTRIDPLVLVLGGPNDGLSYFNAIPYKLIFEVNFNEKAIREGSTFYNMQPPTARMFNGTRYCARSRVVSDTVLVKKHEGFSENDNNSHTQVYLKAFGDHVRPLAERLVGDLTLDPGPLRRAAAAFALGESLRITHRRGSNPYESDCVFNYLPSVNIR